MNDEFKPYIDQLRASNLRPTKQRLLVSKVLFDRPSTFHFTIEKLKQIIEKNNKNKISLATIYNTVHAFKKNGFLKEISLQGNKTFFDTNTKKHHHFYDDDTGELSDIKISDISVSKVPPAPNGKKIKNVEVTVRIATEN